MGKGQFQNLRKLVVCNGVVNVHSVGGGRSRFTNEVTDSGHHSNTTVHNLGFTETLDGIEISVLGKSEGIEEAKRRDGTRKAVHGKSSISGPSVDGNRGRDKR